MKLVLLVVSAMAIFPADSRDFPGKPDKGDFAVHQPEHFSNDQERRSGKEMGLRGKARQKDFKTVLKKLRSMNKKLTQANSEIKKDIQDIKNRPGCPETPEGLFYFPPSNQCFRWLNDERRSWLDAKAACNASGLQLAQPYLPISLRAFLMTKYGDTGHIHTWLDARGTGNAFQWQRTGAIITGSNPYWSPGSPTTFDSSSCLALVTTDEHWKKHPNNPYTNFGGCSHTWWTLCELVSK